jgi:RNA polymerase sigma-70 factor (ECF subfamily)
MDDREDDEARLRRMWDAHHGAVLAYCRRRAAPDVASEVAVEVFAVAWRRLDVVPGEPRGWLLGVARRTLANRRRADARHARLLDRLRERATPEDHGPRLGDPQLAAALAGLTAREREALLLVNWDGLSTAQAAEACGCSKAAFRVRIHRARRRLAARLEAPGAVTRPEEGPADGR